MTLINAKSERVGQADSLPTHDEAKGASCAGYQPAPQAQSEPLDLAAIRAKLASAEGPRFWQSLEELAETKAFQDFLFREFPRQASEWEDDEPGRRKFLKLMGASLALAGLSACTRQPNENIMPYVRAPENIIPG